MKERRNKGRELARSPMFIERPAFQRGVVYNAREAAAGLTFPSIGAFHVSRHKGFVQIPVVRCGGRLLFRGEDLLDFIEQHRDATGSTRRERKGLPSPGRPRGTKAA